MYLAHRRPSVMGSVNERIHRHTTDHHATSTIERWRGSAALPGLLLTLTAITGLVDAVSYLELGNVFVANMTGNVVFLGFGLAAQKTSISARRHSSPSPAFLLGALGGGRVARHHGGHRGRHQAIAATIGLAGFLVALLICLRWGYEVPRRPATCSSPHWRPPSGCRTRPHAPSPSRTSPPPC